MSDELHDPQAPSDELLAVSAHLDGTATAAEIALVASSSTLTELLEQLRADRAALLEVATPSHSRESALAAAMAVFDEIHSPLAAPTLPTAAAVPNVVAFQRRRTMPRVLTAAAAAVAVLFVGVAALRSQSGSNDEEASTSANQERPEAASSKIADDAAPLDSDSAGTGSVEVFGSTMEAPAPADGLAAAEMSPDATASAATETIAAIDAAGQAAGGGPTIASPDQLLAFAAVQVPLVPIEGLAFTCLASGEEALGDVLYQGTQVLVGRVAETGLVTAYDASTCDVVATATP